MIRGGQFVMDNSSLKAVVSTNFFQPPVAGGTIEVTAEQVALESQHDRRQRIWTARKRLQYAWAYHVQCRHLLRDRFRDLGPRRCLRGEWWGCDDARTQGSGSFAHSVSLTNTLVETSKSGFVECCVGGPILIRADNIALNQSTLASSSGEGSGGPITLVSRGGLTIRNSSLDAHSDFFLGGTVDLNAGTSINLTGTIIDAGAAGAFGGMITMHAPVISLRGSTLDAGGAFDGGMISLTGTKAVSLTNGTVLSADGSEFGGTILINGGTLFTSQQSTVSARSLAGTGGTILVEAARVKLTDTQVTTSTSGGPQSVGGNIIVDANKVTLEHSQMLSTAPEGRGGTINITSPRFHQDASSVIDASSQSGTNGTVTINGIIQP